MLRHKRLFALLLGLLLCLCAVGCADSRINRSTHLCVTLIDVEDGDCILITEPNGFSMMIDTGRPEHKSDIKAAMEKADIKKLDVLVLTHPHNDHIGNAVWVLENYEVGEVHQIDRYHDTETYRELQDYLDTHDIMVRSVKAGAAFELGNASCRYIGPISIDTPDLNDASAVLRMQYLDTVFLFMGDAQWTAEALLLNTCRTDIDADVLKVGHHALNSTSIAFLRAVTPDISMVSMDIPDHSSDPAEHRQTLATIESYSNALYRTDRHGDITLVCDGVSVTVHTTEKYAN